MSGAIEDDVALRICERVRSRMVFTQCWGCLRFSGGDPHRMCYYDPPDNRGCQRVNKAFDRGG